MSGYLGVRLTSALRELDRHERRGRGTPFWWRRASMAVLAEKLMVCPWFPGGKPNKRPAYRLTDAGRKYLEDHPNG